MPPADSPVTLSVLDRLLDYEPGQTAEAPLTRAQSVRALKAAVRRDLEWLLNTRRIALEPDAALTELHRSVYVIGLEDFSGHGFDQNQLLRHIQEVIRQFEPRLAHVRIAQQEAAAAHRAVRFRIEASLVMDPAPERISFDTVLQLASGQYQVNEET